MLCRSRCKDVTSALSPAGVASAAPISAASRLRGEGGKPALARIGGALEVRSAVFQVTPTERRGRKSDLRFSVLEAINSRWTKRR